MIGGHRAGIYIEHAEPPDSARRTVGRSLERLFLLFALLIAFAIASALLGRAAAAPAPFPIPRQARPIEERDFVGGWRMLWAGHAWDVTLLRDGGYSCSGTGLAFEGSWAAARNRLFIVEYPRGGNPANGFSFFEIEFDPATLRGEVVSRQSKGTRVQLARRAE